MVMVGKKDDVGATSDQDEVCHLSWDRDRSVEPLSRSSAGTSFAYGKGRHPG